MKKVLSVALVILLHLSIVGLVAFDGDLTGLARGNKLDFGMGVSVSYGSGKNADGENAGECGLVVNIAVVSVNAKGEIVKCKLDCADSKVQFTSGGKAAVPEEFKTKYELGDDYNMVAYGGAVAEWYVQADAFAKLCEGKTMDEVKSLAVDGYKPNDDVVKAGCTIAVSDFIKSIEKAYDNAALSSVKAEDELTLGVVTSAAPVDAAGKDDGKIDITTSVVATALDSDKKTVASSTDVASVTIRFNAKGELTSDITAEVVSKKDAGADYNMATYGKDQDLNGDGVVKEWFEQAAAFDAALVGKDSAGISALAIETGYGSDDLQTAGCPIHVGDMVKAALKAVG